MERWITLELIKKIRAYASQYCRPPYGREIAGTDELLEQAANALNCLAAYEDTGLEPEEVDQILRSCSIARLRELVQAEKDERRTL